MSDAKDYSGMSAMEILNFFRNKYHAEGSDSELGVVANAINELLPKLCKMEHMRPLMYTVDYGTMSEEKVAVFDDRKVSGEEADAFIQRGDMYNQNIVVMSQKQYESLFH